jgi:tetratricopeptide (TPR) repeat protein
MKIITTTLKFGTSKFSLRLVKIILIYLLLITKVNAQETTNRRIDSLVNSLAQANDTTLVNTLNQISKEYTSTGNYTKALEYANNAEKNAEKISYVKGIAYAYNNIGIIYSNSGDYTASMTSYLKALNNFEKINNLIGVANIYGNIGIIHMVQNNYEKSLENTLKSLAIKEKLGDKKALLTGYNNLGLIYCKKNEYDKALENYFKCVELLKAKQDKNALAVCYNNIGNTYKLQKKYGKALDIEMKALLISKEIADTQSIGYSYYNIGCLYIELNDYELAKKYINDALAIDKKIGNKDAVKEEYISLSTLYEKQGDYARAFEYHQLYASVKDSLLNEESSRQIAEMNTKYESEKKEKDIQLLTKDKKLQETEIGKQKLIKNLFIIGLLIAVCFAFIILNRFRVTRKQKIIIEHQNEQIVESINYSKRIQNSLLPNVAEIKENIPSLFVLYEPKNIVSGDFYYFKRFENYSVLACVDCTGHGVPGGFMSTLGSLLLDKIVNNKALKPSEILIQLNNEIIRILHQQAGGELQDGMDLSVCLIDKKNGIIEYSGARNGIIVVKNNEAKRYKANPLPVGGNYMKKGVPIERNFKTESIALNNNDWVFMYTDGFIEQIGGIENQPMNYEQFEKQLINTTRLNTDEEKIDLLKSELTTWSGNNEQTDDVLIIGFNLSKHDSIS